MKTTTFLILFPTFIFISCRSTNQNATSLGNDIVPGKWNADLSGFMEKNSLDFWAYEFNATELTELIKLSNKNNYELNSMYQRVVARGEDATMVGATIFPKANAHVSGSKTKRNLIGFNFPNSETSFTSNSFSSGINISWELDLWGKIKNQKLSAKKRFEASLLDYEAAKLSLNGQVAKAWFNFLENSHQIQLVEKTINTYSKNLTFINNRYEKGLATALDQKLAEASFKSSQSTLAQRRRIENNLTQILLELIGSSPSEKINFNTTSSLPELIMPPLPPTPSEVVNARHDLLSAKLQIAASGLDLKVAQKNLLPSLTLTGSPGSRSDNFEDLIDKKFRVWDISGGISQPLFQGGRLRAGVRKAKALQKAALLNFKAIALRSFYEIENTLSADGHLATEEKKLKEASLALANAADLTWDRYQNGLEGIFNTLDTRRRAFEAQSRFLSAKKERILNRINLYIAIGMKAVAPEL
ncbi:MAG: TolC family protein [Opitutae bacterium]|jgi:outer membrane protein, multidrug efflux system|nr:TolC family protein [Opitutae bacterium]MBT5716628.1 TolC family protein [Opitutae bacterium]